MDTKTLFDRLIRIRLPQKPEPAPVGLHHYMRAAGDAFTRFHLRVEPDGSGMLLANAATAARLSPAGVVIARGLLAEQPEAKVQAEIERRFRGMSQEQVQRDLERVRSMIEGLAAPEDGYPILNLTDAAFLPHEAELFAPLEADLPLAPPEQLVPIIDRLWEIGIPHVTFLAPVQFDPAHLVRAVERAEDLGMIAGVRGRAIELRQGTLLRDLAQAGVDHVTLLAASAESDVHDALCGEGDYQASLKAIEEVQQNEVCPVAEIPLVEATIEGLRQTITARLALGIGNFSVFAIAAADEMPAAQRAGAFTAGALRQVAATVEEMADELQTPVMWQPPVGRNTAVSLAEQVQRGPRCTGDVSVRVEPDGAVIPPRGPYRRAGNLLRDEWQKIWEDPAFTTYRQRVEAPTHCQLCPGLAICAADCPARPEGWATGGNE